MQKKILASLLVTPLAFNAMANIQMDPINNQSWTATGLAGDDLIINTTDNSVTAAIGTGILKQNLKLSAPGTYRISFTRADNVKITVNGETCDKVVSDGSSIDFVLKSAGDVTVQLTATKADELFSFAGGSVEIVYDFKAQNDLLTAELAKAYKYVALDAENKSENAEALRKENQALQATVRTIREEIAELVEPGKIETYEKYKLYADPNTIAKEIAALAHQSTELNEKIASENDLYATVTANTTAMNGLFAGVATLQEALDNAKPTAAEGETLSDYVMDTYTDGAAPIQAEIEAYKKAIEDAYADLSKKDITVENQQAEIQTKIDELANKCATAVQNEKAFAAFNALKSDLEKVYQKAQISITAFEGVKDFTNVFAANQASWMNSISEIKTNADTDLAQTDINNAAENAEANAQTVQKAINDINKVVADASSFVEAENTAKETADTAVKDVTDSFSAATAEYDKAAESLTISDDIKAGYDTKVKAINDAITALIQKINEAYGKNLATTDYTADIQAINALIADLNKFIEDNNLAEKAAAQNALNALKDYVKKQSQEAGLEGIVDVYSKFNNPDGTFESLQAAIDALTPENNESVLEAIDKAKANADNLIAAFKAANDAYTTFHEAITALTKVVESKNIIKGENGYDKTNGIDKTLIEFNTTDQEWLEERTKAAEADAQTCYDLAIKLAEKIAGYGWNAKVLNAFNEFEDNATKGNYAVAEAKLSAIKSDWDDGDYEGKATVDFTDIDATMTKINGDIAADVEGNDATDKQSGEAKVKAGTTADEAIVAAMVEMDKLEASIKALKNNKSAYNALLDSWNDIQAEIDALIAFNEKTSLSPALEFYADQIKGELTGEQKSLQQKYDALKASIEEAYKNLTAATDQDKLTDAIKSLSTDITNMEAAIQANEDAHNAQMSKSQEAREVITANLAKIQNGTDQELVVEWVKTLEELRDNDLVNTDRDVTAAYKVGESAPGTAFMNAYDEIIAKANIALGGFEGGYHDKVVESNNETMDNAGWTGKVQNLRATYTSSINKFNEYKAIKNAGYKAYLTENDVFKTHESLYEYAKLIRTLEAEVTKAITDANTANEVLTAEKFAEIATDKANAMILAMNKAVKDMVDGFNAAGVAYYTIADGNANGAITEATELIIAAGLSNEEATEILSQAKGYLKTAEDAYAAEMSKPDEVENNGETVANPNKNIGLAMDSIADELDKVAPAIDLQAGAMTKWNSEYTYAKEILDKLAEELKGYEFAEQDVVKAQTAAFNNAVDGAATLNTTAITDTELINNLASDLNALNAYIEAAQNAVASVKASNDGNVANQDAYKNYTETVIPAIGNDYDELCAFVNALGGASNVDLGTVKTSVDYVSQLVERYKANLTGNATRIQNAINAASTAIANCYTDAASAEIGYLKVNLLGQVKVAYNDAHAAGQLSAETLVGYNNRINDIDSEIKGMVAPEADKTKRDEWKTTAVKMEQELCSIMTELQKSHQTDTTLHAVLKALGEKAGEVSESLTNGQAALADYEQSVKDSYTGDYAGYAEELAAINAAIEEAGDQVIAQQENLMNRLNKLAGQIAETNKKAADDQVVAKAKAEKEAASNSRYAELKSQLDEYIAATEALQTRIDNYSLTEDFASRMASLNQLIELSKEWLEQQREAFALTAETVLRYEASISNRIFNFTQQSTLDYANIQAAAAYSGLTAVGNELSANIVPAVKNDISNSLSALWVDYDNLMVLINAYNIYNPENGGVTELEYYVSKAQQLITDAEALMAKAKANEFALGDLNGNPDGEVGVSDVQILINMIGEGMTYEELYQENPILACAADMTGDKVLNIADVTAIIEAALDNSTAALTTTKYVMHRGMVQSASSIDAVLISEENGIRRYAINLTNSEAFVAGQFDLKVAAGSEIVSIEAADRAGMHDMYTFDNLSNKRVILASLQNAVMQGNEGATVIVEVRGKSAVTIDNAIFADENSQAYELRSSTGPADGTTFIDGIYQDAKAVKEAIYDAAGRTMQRIQRGLNIIRHSDGTVTKELHK